MEEFRELVRDYVHLDNRLSDMKLDQDKIYKEVQHLTLQRNQQQQNLISYMKHHNIDTKRIKISDGGHLRLFISRHKIDMTKKYAHARLTDRYGQKTADEIIKYLYDEREVIEHETIRRYKNEKKYKHK